MQKKSASLIFLTLDKNQQQWLQLQPPAIAFRMRSFDATHNKADDDNYGDNA